jgi:ABC-type Fe3+-hydroxamate transport system substrate-binding protein
VALKPDLVLVSMASRAIARMEALGLKVVALEPRTHEEARTVMQKMGSCWPCRQRRAQTASGPGSKPT